MEPGPWKYWGRTSQTSNTVTNNISGQVTHVWHFELLVGLYSMRTSYVSLQFSFNRQNLGPTQSTRGLIAGVKAAGARSWPLTSIKCRGQECVELYLLLS